MKKKKAYSFMIALFVPMVLFNLAYGQTQTVTGRVTGEGNESLPGTSIMIKGSTLGTTTAADGTYSIQVPGDSARLVFSFIGYALKEVVVGNKTVINVALEPDLETLGEVVVIGYGTQSKATTTVATSSIKGEELTKVPTNTISSKLQGRLPGVSIRTISGQPGQELQIRVRGGSSINKSNDPLVIIDGFQRTLNDIVASSKGTILTERKVQFLNTKKRAGVNRLFSLAPFTEGGAEENFYLNRVARSTFVNPVTVGSSNEYGKRLVRQLTVPLKSR